MPVSIHRPLLTTQGDLPWTLHQATQEQAKWQLLKLAFHLTVSGVVIVLSLCVFIYPAVTICILVCDSQLRTTGESRLVPCGSSRPRRDSCRGRTLLGHELCRVAPPRRHSRDGMAHVRLGVLPGHGRRPSATRQRSTRRRGPFARRWRRPAQIVASPVTATWVKTKWGDGYLEKENVFYRMLLILGLSSYERITGDAQYRALMSQQRTTLAEELAAAKLHLRDDYPDECYPADMLWAVAAIQRGAAGEADHDELAESDRGVRRAAEGHGGAARLSGRVALGPDLKGLAAAATRAFSCLPPNWTRWSPVTGTTPTKRLLEGHRLDRRLHRDAARHRSTGLMDVDSGPVLCEVGSVASAFGIGAAKSVGDATTRRR